MKHPEFGPRDFTWVGHPGNDGYARYRGKGMRLDYFLLPRNMACRVEQCAPTTSQLSDTEWVNRAPSGFFGSDHCAVVLKLKPAEEGAVGAGDSGAEPKE